MGVGEVVGFVGSASPSFCEQSPQHDPQWSLSAETYTRDRAKVAFRGVFRFAGTHQQSLQKNEEANQPQTESSCSG